MDAWGILDAVLAEGQARGSVGPGSRRDAVAHARAFWPAAMAGRPDDPPLRCVDLGSGAGLPGLVLALAHPTTAWTLVEVRQARADRLAAAVARLQLDPRVVVAAQPAEVVGRGGLRGVHDLVVARGFGAPARTAECAAPLLRHGGRLVVSDVRAGADDRWPADGLAVLGLAAEATWETAHGRFRSFHQGTLCPAAYPRRPGVPARRPLF
jgi:16S rRNA (guanine527-N7)-methyltransferase